MRLKQLGTPGIVFAAGFLIAWIIHARDESGAPPAEHGVVAPVTSDSTDSIAALRSEYERQIVDLQNQLEMARLEAKRLEVKKLEKNGLPATLTIQDTDTLAMKQLKQLANGSRARLTNEDIQAAVHDSVQRAREANTRLETDRLLAAGFTMDRIEWLRKRAEELAAEFKQTSGLLRQQGKPDIDGEAAHNYDSDIGLRKEVGDDEYTRYRQAVGRPIGVPVATVLSGGGGETAGIKPGDQIIAYNGTRIFNFGELVTETKKTSTSGAVMDLEVLRDGRKIHLSAAGGNLRIRAEVPIR